MEKQQILKTSKICRLCSVEKDFINFRDQKTTKDGKKSYCIPCENQYNKNLYYKKLEERKAQITEWQKNNKEKIKIHQKAYRAKLSRQKAQEISENPKNLENPPNK